MIPDNELIEDRFQSLLELYICGVGLIEGIRSDKIVERVDGNKRIVDVIEKELDKRGIKYE
jgi:hypothetical protein